MPNECDTQLEELQTEYDLLTVRADNLSRDLEDYKKLANEQAQTILLMKDTIEEFEKDSISYSRV